MMVSNCSSLLDDNLQLGSELWRIKKDILGFGLLIKKDKNFENLNLSSGQLTFIDKMMWLISRENNC